MPSSTSRCVDCPAGARRKAPHPGPRCATHHRLVLAQRRRTAHSRRIQQTYGITADEYDAIYQAQDGRCYICRRATGKRKRLAVDHNHETGEVRGLLCKACNRDVLGHLRDDVEALGRAIEYLINPPARVVLGRLHGSANNPDRSDTAIVGSNAP